VELKLIKTLVVDDEPIARRSVCRQLEGEADIDIIGVCGSGREALSIIQKQKPDLVFLDIHMPELDGFELLENVKLDEWPTIIFVTAYERYALRAFDIHVLDYLLKPFDRERFQKALNRARRQIRDSGVDQTNSRVLALIESLKRQQNYLERFAINSGGRTLFLNAQEIEWVEAADNYVLLHVGRKEHLLHETMGSIETKLDPRSFLRIHRSKIVNLGRVKELQPMFHGNYVVTMSDGSRLTSGRSYRAKLQILLTNGL